MPPANSSTVKELTRLLHGESMSVDVFVNKIFRELDLLLGQLPHAEPVICDLIAQRGATLAGLLGLTQLAKQWSALSDSGCASPDTIGCITEELNQAHAALALTTERPENSHLILVVDDDYFSRNLLRQALEYAGYAVIEAESGSAGLELFESEHPTLVLVDANMPGMDGFTLCESIVACGTNSTVIMITGLKDEDSVERAFQIGAADYVTKPVHVAVLLKRIERLLAAKMTDDQLKKARAELEMRVAERTGELVRANEALRLSEQQFRRITDNMLDMIWQTSFDNVVQYASPSCWHVLGYNPNEMVGRSIYSWVHPDDVAMVNEGLLNEGRAEYRCIHANGSYIWLESLTSLLFDERGNGPTTVIFASRDITHRKRAEQELHELNRIKTDFLSTAAHELRTPLVSLRGFAEIMLTRKLEESRQQRYLTLINEQAIHLGKIVDDLLDIARLESQRRLTLTLEPINLSDLAAHAITMIGETAPNHPLELKNSGNCLPVLGDGARLTQVLRNLLSNAIKYSPSGGTVSVSVEPRVGFTMVSIKDQGIGLTQEQQSHLFEKFYRANASNTAVGGTGLGLAICQLIVEMHGGHIWAESEYGHGSTFSFTVPTVPA